MTEADPRASIPGRLLLDQLVDCVPGREVVGHDRVDGQMHSVDERRLTGCGSGGERRPQDPEQAGVIDDLHNHLPAAVALYRYHERDVVSHRYAAERAASGTASRPAKVLVRLILGS